MIDAIRTRPVPTAVVAAALAAAAPGTAATHEFQPFVTDFPKALPAARFIACMIAVIAVGVGRRRRKTLFGTPRPSTVE
jgi:hypothetical protein